MMVCFIARRLWAQLPQHQLQPHSPAHCAVLMMLATSPHALLHPSNPNPLLLQIAVVEVERHHSMH
jgi:hypothetical protein